MDYSKEGFLSLYEQLKTLENKIDEERRNKVPENNLQKEKSSLQELKSKLWDYANKLWDYAINLIEQNPDNREIACIVYSAFDFHTFGIYERLSDNLKNDKLVTMLALKKFDSSAYGRVGNNFRNDPEVMYLLIKQVNSVDGISQCSPELLGNPEFWREIFESRNECLASEIGDNFCTVIDSINRLNKNYGTKINMGLVTEQFNSARLKESRYSPLDVMGFDWPYSPEIVQRVVNGDTETIEKYLPPSKLKDELLGKKDFTKEQDDEER